MEDVLGVFGYFALLLAPVALVILRSSTNENKVCSTSEQESLLKTAMDRAGKDVVMSKERFLHQVAGHTKEVLLSGSKRIFKPLVKESCFFRELAFYESVYSKGDHCGASMKAIIPAYNGVVCEVKPSSQETILPYLELEDLTSGMKLPCVCDIKMGLQTYEPSASEEKKDREVKKYPHQSIVGFRITGFKVFDANQRVYNTVDKSFGRSLAPDRVKAGLALFFHNGVHFRRDVLLVVIQKLEAILSIVKAQTAFQFYCSSILIVYEGNVGSWRWGGAGSGASSQRRRSIPVKELELGRCFLRDDRVLRPFGSAAVSAGPTLHPEDVSVKLIDFAHTLPSQGQDEGYVYSVKSLLSKLFEIVQDIDHGRSPFQTFSQLSSHEYTTPRHM